MKTGTKILIVGSVGLVVLAVMALRKKGIISPDTIPMQPNNNMQSVAAAKQVLIANDKIPASPVIDLPVLIAQITEQVQPPTRINTLAVEPVAIKPYMDQTVYKTAAPVMTYDAPTAIQLAPERGSAKVYQS